MSHLRPPRLARALLRLVTDPSTRATLVSDLDEEFELIQARDGRHRAVRWYLQQTAASLPAIVIARLRRAIRTSAAPGGGPAWFTALAFDARHAVRRCLRQPRVTTAVLLSAALAIASTTAVFSVVEALLLRPLPFRDAGRLVRVAGVDSRYPANGWGGISILNARDLAERSRSLELMALYNHNWTGTLLLEGQPHPLRFAVVGPGLAQVLGLEPVLGRTFADNEYVPGGDAVAVLTDRGWRELFGADRSILGRTMTVDGRVLTIVGVLPPVELEFPREDLAFWAPLAPPTAGPGSWRSHRGTPWLRAVGRLRTGATVAQAQLELDAIGATLAEEYPDINRTRGFRVIPLKDSIVGPVGPTLWLLAGAVAAVLLVACGNIAMLQLAQAQNRRREFAVRAALGGGGIRVVRQVLTESVMLMSLGGILGILGAPLLVDVFLALNPQPLPRSAEISLNGASLLLAGSLALAAALVAAIPAAGSGRRPSLGDSLRSAPGQGGTASERGMRSTLVVAQVAFSVVVLFGAGVLVRSFWNLTRVDLGFDPSNRLTFLLTPTTATSGPASRFYTLLEERLRALPGVAEVGMSYDLPTAGRSFNATVLREGSGDEPGNAPAPVTQMVSPRLFSALGIPLEEGRDFQTGDREGAPPVVIVNRAFATRLFPGQSVLGRRLILWEQSRTIVGVVADARTGLSLWEPPSPEVYAPLEQVQQEWRYLVIQARGDPAALIPAVRAEVQRLDPTLLLGELATLEDRVSRSMAPQRFRGALLSALGLLALILSVIGIHGVTAYGVSRRIREIGIRVALGERRELVRRRVVGGALLPAVTGTLLGGAIALATAGLLESFVLGVGPRDPVTLVVTSLLFLAVAVAAAMGPAHRAGRVDPTVALREE